MKTRVFFLEIKKATSILLMARWFVKIVLFKAYLRRPRRWTLPEHQMTNVKIMTFYL